MGDGHCGLPTGELVALSEKLLEVPQALIGTALDLELAEGTVTADSVGETACVFSAASIMPRGIADRLKRLLSGSLPWPVIDAIRRRDRTTHRAQACRQSSRGHLPGAALQGAGHHRRSGRRQDDHRQLDPAHPLGQGREASPLRSHRPSSQAHE